MEIKNIIWMLGVIKNLNTLGKTKQIADFIEHWTQVLNNTNK